MLNWKFEVVSLRAEWHVDGVNGVSVNTGRSGPYLHTFSPVYDLRFSVAHIDDGHNGDASSVWGVRVSPCRQVNFVWLWKPSPSWGACFTFCGFLCASHRALT